jgi:gliding motility-associated-like protein
MQLRYFIFLFLLSSCLAGTLQAQLDSIHWIPPMHGRAELGPQYLYMSTPETTPFDVSIRDGGGNLLGTVTISNAQPTRWLLGSSDNTVVMVSLPDLQVSVKNKGLVLSAAKKFYANLRFHSNSQYQAADLTCKGVAALGKEFRIGHVYQGGSNSQRSNFVGVMATEDSTVVTLSDFDAGTRLVVAGNSTLVSTPQSVTLQAGESVVYSLYVTAVSNEPPNGLIGAKLASNKPVAVNCGSWTGSPVDNSNDVGIDQIAPFEQVGEEYILCKGNGSSDLETPLVIAHVDNTAVWLNGAATPAAVLNAGEYLRIPTSSYSAAGNLYILTSKPAFVYQIIGGIPSGDDAKRTAGLIFVPPISCSIPNAVDNIYLPNQIGNITYDGGLMIVAMRDSLVEVRINNNLIALGAPDAVPGNPDFVTYRRLTLFSANTPLNTASIVAKGAVQVAMFGRNGAAGFGSFYSGFSKTRKADLSLSLVGDGVCPDTLVATGRFDGVQWYFADSLLTYGPDTFFVAYSPGLYTARGYLGVCRRTNFAEDTISAKFNSPVFPFSSEDPSCYGFSDGQVLFGMPSGGLEPYSYSINQGQSFTQNPIVGGLRAGTYQLVVRDSTGCYNRPLEIQIGQPDSLSVDLAVVKIEEPVKVGDVVLLGASPNRPVVDAQWLPAGAGMADFLNYTATPIETTNYTVVVTDSEGCTATDLVRIILQPNVFVPNVFKPESSSGNERFTLFSKDNLPVNWLRIYDRWGSLIFENKGFVTNNLAAGWDGTYRGDLMNPGVFVFIAEVEYEPGLKIRLEGDVTLLR